MTSLTRHSVAGDCESRRDDAVLKLPGEISSLLGHPLTRRMSGDSAEMDAAAADLNKEEDVKAS
ncbi:MAG TPA: hypothetical protein DCF65_07695 [Chloroflexi bacterium]|nr:hypothetical protein [Chloroflexota bacterium]HAF18185.1 hypothetical protein [Chloroflexota bacterium]